jgi:predicted dehydrogenase
MKRVSRIAARERSAAPSPAAHAARTTGVAVVGCGYWGPNLVRVFSGLDGAEVRAVFDADVGRAKQLTRRYPAVRCAERFRQILDDPEIHAVSICTPVRSHNELATAALRAGKHVMVEKPLTDSVETAERLVELADRMGRTLQVDHTFIYSGAVQKIRSIIDSGALGDLLYVDSVRVNLGLFQHDVSVLWDLAPHDISIIAHLIDQKPRWVSAVGSTHYGDRESQAYVTLKFNESLMAHLHVNWLAPVKLRSTLIGGSKRMIVYDDLEPSEKIRVYEKGVTLNGGPERRASALVDYRVGDMFAPYIDKTEPLQRVCESFIEAIRTGTPPLTDGRAGLEVVRILEAAQESIRKDGERVWLDGSQSG